MTTLDISRTRQEIDAIDDALQELIRARTELSRRIQAERMAHGGSRLAHTRELEVIDRWHAGLGRPGVAIARAVLELSRGADSVRP